MATSTSILIVDPDPLTTRDLRSTLERRGRWKLILEARNGPEAITAASRSEPDVIVVKHKRPHPNGGTSKRTLELDATQITRSILKDMPRLRILIVCDDYTMLQRAFEAGAFGYVLSAQVENDLEGAIEQLLLGRTFFSAEAVRSLRIRYHRQPYPNEYPDLTPIEVQVLQLVAEGKANSGIAAALGVNERTVQEHVTQVKEKLKLGSLSGLTRYAIRIGIVEP